MATIKQIKAFSIITVVFFHVLLIITFSCAKTSKSYTVTQHGYNIPVELTFTDTLVHFADLKCVVDSIVSDTYFCKDYVFQIIDTKEIKIKAIDDGFFQIYDIKKINQ